MTYFLKNDGFILDFLNDGEFKSIFLAFSEKILGIIKYFCLNVCEVINWINIYNFSNLEVVLGLQKKTKW